MADQQFCLRWNNHQNTLISVFDSLLEGEILVDCTLAAEGRFLRAHKVVLSACSPFFSDLLRQHYEKHPILIMKDVKFDQLKAMLDYMYRGEVNISQDQLGSFLKAAESLQIKGLSDSAQNFDSHSKQKSSNESRTPRTSSVPEDDATKRPNNTSPTPRQKKRRRLSGSGDETVPEETSNDQVLETGTPLSKTSVNCRLSNPASPPNSSVTNKEDDVDPPEASTSVSNRVQPVPSAVLLNKSEPSRQQPPSILDSEMFVPKSEFIELDGDEDLTEDGDNMEAGPSHSNSDAGGYSWHVDRPDESFLSPELATQRNAQGDGEISASCGMDASWLVEQSGMHDNTLDSTSFNDLKRGASSNYMAVQESAPWSINEPSHNCPRCGKSYQHKGSLSRHLKVECGNLRSEMCSICMKSFLYKHHLDRHMKFVHNWVSEFKDTVS